MHAEMETANILLIAQQVVNFMLNYFDWWPSFICSITTIVVQLVSRAIFLSEAEDGESVTTMMLCMVCLAMSLLVCHLVTLKVGRMYIETLMQRQGNLQLLDSLHEGVMIVQETSSQETLFYNKSAKQLSLNKFCDSSVSLSVNDCHLLQNKNEKNFAHIDLKLLKSNSEVIHSQSCYKSIS